MRVGLGVGPTTIKYVVLSGDNQIIRQSYERYFPQIAEKMVESLRKIQAKILDRASAHLSVSGSARMGTARVCNLPLIQEAYATCVAMSKLIPDADVAIELGDEDVKTLFLTGGTEVYMNGSRAGGTGAFVDQMAALLHISLKEMNELAA